ncbi:MAG: hypothetical protein WBG30_08900 [Psychrilyobacter sp.]|uniref:hypothetical protein n=1 Tax=Psychrilyobacter sp. TaxID=2586924 RepID=UPI003C775952
MIIKAVEFKEAVKRVSFIKGINKIKARKWLTDRNVIEADGVFLIMDSEMKLGVKIHEVFTPKEIEIDFKY